MRTRNSGAVATALRAAGFVPLPRLWVTPSELETITKMALNHRYHTNKIRQTAAIQSQEEEDESDLPEWDPCVNMPNY